MSEKENAGKKYSPLTYALYEELKRHVDSENGISAQELADKFGISKRTLRYFVSVIRTSPDFDICIMSGNDGYWCVSSLDGYKKASSRLYRQAFSILRCARETERKANRHNQGRISDVESQFSDFFKSFMEDDN